MVQYYIRYAEFLNKNKLNVSFNSCTLDVSYNHTQDTPPK